jgi:serine/threonine protein kinase
VWNTELYDTLTLRHLYLFTPAHETKHLLTCLLLDVAPEVLQEGTERKYGFSVDIWSCGVVMYICLCGFPPFSDELYSKDFPYTLAQQIKEGRFDYPSPYWDKVGDPALDLIDNMLVVNFRKRFTVRQCLEHPWMRDVVPRILAEPIRTASPEPM